ncbi:MAG: LysM peptidoglycan-binding domain-containing protein, partial [Anaerolineaceae bacterium]|nr:LysM peptidoglycan-binding domain-containing protein [Anaerolineaceae bacterium]
LCLPMLVLNTIPAAAQDTPPLPGPWDLIADVNSLRGSRGLPAMKVNPYLMASSQAYAEYLVATGSGGHYENGTPDTRAAAAGYPMLAGVDVMECWAASFGTVDLNDVIYNAWGDAEHMNVMLNQYAVHVGAGIAKDSDGRIILILDVGADFNGSLNNLTPMPTLDPNATLPPNGFEPTREYVNGVITSTPQADGRIVHEVQSGESAWAIAVAYGVKISDITKQNNLGDTQTPVLYIGQRLLIKTVPTVVPTATQVPTIAGGKTSTPRPTSTRQPRPSRTPVVTATPQPQTVAGIISEKGLPIALIVICSVGLVTVIVGSFAGKKK